MGISPAALARAWTLIGLKSAGGGSTVQLVAYETLVRARKWIEPRDWAESWGLVQLMPGMNILALAALTGSRLAGATGALVSVGGLFVPSVIVTIALTAGYGRIHNLQPIEGAVHGLAAAAVGGSCVLSWRLAAPILRTLVVGNLAVWILAMAIVPASALLVVVVHVPVYVVLLGAGVAMAAMSLVDGRGSPHRDDDAAGS